LLSTVTLIEVECFVSASKLESSTEEEGDEDEEEEDEEDEEDDVIDDGPLTTLPTEDSTLSLSTSLN